MSSNAKNRRSLTELNLCGVREMTIITIFGGGRYFWLFFFFITPESTFTSAITTCARDVWPSSNGERHKQTDAQQRTTNRGLSRPVKIPNKYR